MSGALLVRSGLAAMFAMPTDLQFVRADSKAEVREAFRTLQDVVGSSADDSEAATETFWGALHGLAEL